MARIWNYLEHSQHGKIREIGLEKSDGGIGGFGHAFLWVEKSVRTNPKEAYHSKRCDLQILRGLELLHVSPSGQLLAEFEYARRP